MHLSSPARNFGTYDATNDSEKRDHTSSTMYRTHTHTAVTLFFLFFLGDASL